MTSRTKQIVFVALVSEGALLLLTILGSWMFGVPIPLLFTSQEIWLGVRATGPLLAFNFAVFVLLAPRLPGYAPYHRFIEHVVKPLCRDLPPIAALLVAILAGLGEEAFFRGLLEPLSATVIGPTGGMLLSAILFAAVHFIGAFREYWRLIPYYVLFGLYFSMVVKSFGSILPAMVAHALYNFVVILFVRYTDRTPPVTP